MAKSKWQSLTLPSLAGVLDVRSRPADIANTSLRWKENFGINDTGHLARCQGFRKAFPWMSSGGVYSNADLHRQESAIRSMPTLLYEHTGTDGTKTLFAGTEDRLYRYDPGTGEWSAILVGGTTGTRWKCASLGNYIVIANDYDYIRKYLVTGTDAPAIITTLKDNLKVSRGKVVVYFFGFVLVMNVVQDNVRQSSRVRWCDLNDVDVWEYSEDAGTVAGYQDLDYGDPILAAAPLGSNLYIYTARNIWRCYLNTASTVPLAFQRVYSEPKNQTGCLAYPNSLVSTGDAHYFMARDGIYKFTQYSSAPERVGWIHAASALIYSDQYETHIDSSLTDTPVAEFDAIHREIIFSWPDDTDASDGSNMHSLVCNTVYNTCDYRNVGWSALVNFTSDSTGTSVNPYLIGASGYDWCLKMLGGVFYREYATLATKGTNSQTPPTYTQVGYDSLIRGLLPLGIPDRLKAIRRMILDHETVAEVNPPLVMLRIGESEHLCDPNQTTGYNRPQWHELEDRLLKAPDTKTVEELAAKGLRPDARTEWPMYLEGAYLYFELKIAGEEGALAEGADTAWSELRYEVAAV